VGVFVLMLVGMVLEALNIGLLLPVLAVLTGDGSAVPAFLRPWFAEITDGESRGVLLVLLSLVGVYALKSGYLLFAAYWESRLARRVQADTSTRLFSIFLGQPWPYHLETSSSTIQHAITECQRLSFIYLQVIKIISETFVLAGLLALLLAMEPLGTVVVAVMLGLSFWIFNGLVRPHARRWAAVRKSHAKMAIEYTQQAVGGARELKVGGAEREFIDRFRVHADGLAAVATRTALLERAPRQLFELIALIALCLLAAAMAAQGRPKAALVPMLGLFATVAFRVLPSVSHSAVIIQWLHQHEPTIASLRRLLSLEENLPPSAPTYPCPFRDRIRVDGVAYRYPGQVEPALQAVDIEIPRGAKVGIVGGSGAGKTTFVDILLGLLPPEQGRVTVDGVDIRDNVRGWQWIIGYVPQMIYVADDTIRRNIAFGVPEPRIDDDAVRRALSAARLDDFVSTLPAGLETPAGEWGTRLSGGQRQRIGIARALYHDPQLLVLDEATSALDAQTEREVMDAVDALHGVKTLVIVAHRLSTVENCDLVYRLEGGRVVRSGSFTEVFAKAEASCG
jgi:ABC-type multidrug transport system fused ATPase/permease subunit